MSTLSNQLRRGTRALTLAGAAAVAAAVTPDAARAQQAASLGRGLELRPFVGAFVPTGDQRDLLKDAVLTGAQIAYRLNPSVSIVGTAAWSPSTDKTTWGPNNAPRSHEDVDLYQYDLGVEGHLPKAYGTAAVAVSPFATLGAGGRTYHYRDVRNLDAETHVVGFAGIGTDIGPQSGRWAVRLEARDYVGAFKGLRGELAERKARNDVVLAAGLTLNLGNR
jgi:hypothetical protein